MGEPRLLHVFLAEDNSADVYMVRESLQRAGLEFKLHVANDGEEAMKLIEQFGRELPCPHIALLDLNLPRHNGAALLRRWQEYARCKGTPIVILTSSEAPNDQSLATEYKAVFFRKPLDMDEFFRIGEIVSDLCLRRPDGIAR